MPTVFSANRSSVLVDGEAVEGLQSLAFRVVTEREDIRAIGTNERVDVIFGLRTVQGEMVIRSANVKLDGLLQARAKFQLVTNLKRTEGNEETRTLSFDDCFVEGKSFQLDAHGSAATTYAFTATRIREE
ncbi:hypothetical protein [Pyxidicoccus trucidator]|jgi:hypothetical protein|uniref:hypothetical protein n=1 Tax=Pyxidicoccus trucidator TaxID=2709662 RepID=UPI0013DA8E94|nr:hypothetical protein [Pyxidicoccus trucidator]